MNVAVLESRGEAEDVDLEFDSKILRSELLVAVSVYMVRKLRWSLGTLKGEMKVRVAWRNIKNYVKHDLKEIAFPSSLPNPPSFQAKPKPRKLALKDHLQVGWQYSQRIWGFIW